MPDHYLHKSQSNSSALPNKAIKRIGLISLFIGAEAFIGWIFNIKNLETVIPGMVTMKLNVGICFALLGWALITKNGQQNRWKSIIYRILLILVTLIGGVTLLEYLIHFNAHIDQLFVTDPQPAVAPFAFPGRMAYNTATSFTLLGLCLLGLSTKPCKFHIILQYLLHVVTVIAGTAIMGYIYGVSMLYKLSYVSSMAIHTATLLFLVSIAASLLNPKLGITGLFKGPGIGNRMARRHFTTLMLVLIVFGSLRIQSERFHILPPEIGISLLAIGLLLTSLIMIWITANWLNKLDDQRSKAEEEIRNINANLEIKVEERSAKLRELYVELQKSEANLQTILNNTDTAYALLNADLDILEYNNKALIFAQNEFNFDQENTAKIYDLMAADRRSQFLAYTNQVFDGNVISYEVSYPQADNIHLWYYVRMFPIADKGDKILGLVLAITDITERKDAEQDLQTAYQSIQSHIDKIREMAWKQSHLIRSPLANLKGLLPMLKVDPSDQQVLEFIETELERMDKILWEMAEGTSMVGVDKIVDNHKQ